MRHDKAYLVSCIFAAKNTSCHWAGVQTHAHRKIARVGAQSTLQLLGQLVRFNKAVTSEASHGNGMVPACNWKAAGGHVAICEKRVVDQTLVDVF